MKRERRTSLRRLLPLVLPLVVGAFAPAFAEERSFYLSEVRFEGNRNTRDEVLLQEMALRPGTTISAGEIEEARQAVMDLGLFKSVRAELEETPIGTILTLRLEEKHFILPVPIVNGDPQTQNFEWGLELRMDNVAGLNQHLKARYLQEQSSDLEIPRRKEALFTYSYPRMFGSPYQFALSAARINEEFRVLDESYNVIGNFDRDTNQFSVNLSRWLNIDLGGPSRGWNGGLGLAIRQENYDQRSGPPGLRSDAQAVSLTTSLGRSEVHEHGYYNTGSAYGWGGEVGGPSLGSDFDFSRNLFYYRTYHHFEGTKNLNWQFRVGLGHGEVFQTPAYSIGGFTTMRGYERSLRGNAYALSNLEYHQQIDDLPTVRGVAFLDLGNVYPSVSEMNPGDLEAGVGIGFRWRIQSLVNVTASADAGYGIGPGTWVFYLGTSGTF